VVSTPVKNMKVSWGYYSQLNGKIKFIFQTTNLKNVGFSWFFYASSLPQK
jgi:hypothetical protein